MAVAFFMVWMAVNPIPVGFKKVDNAPCEAQHSYKLGPQHICIQRVIE